MDNNSIQNGFQYTFAIMLVLLAMVLWQVYFVQRPKINMLQLEHESGLSCSTAEGMYDTGHGHGLRFGALQSEKFFGGNEPPVFYNIGDIQAARDMRSVDADTYSLSADGKTVTKGVKSDYNIKMLDLGEHHPDTGKPIMSAVQFNGSKQMGNLVMKTNRDGKKYFEPCPPGTRVSTDQLNCAVPVFDPDVVFEAFDPVRGIEENLHTNNNWS